MQDQPDAAALDHIAQDLQAILARLDALAHHSYADAHLQWAIDLICEEAARLRRPRAG